MKTTETLIFLIEGGKALELVKAHIAARLATEQEIRAICTELGVSEYTTNPINGHLVGVVFPAERHPDFKVPTRRGVSYPKKGSEWEKRLQAHKGYPAQTSIIQEQLGVPCTIEWEDATGHGWQHIGNCLNECGFLYLGTDGPYGMWIPNIPAEVAKIEAEGRVVVNAAKTFKPELEGCRLIEREEWEILVAQHKLEQKRKKQEGGTA